MRQLSLSPAHSLEMPHCLQGLGGRPPLDYSLEIHIASVIEQLRPEDPLAAPVEQKITIQGQIAVLWSDLPTSLRSVQPNQRAVSFQSHLAKIQRRYTANRTIQVVPTSADGTHEYGHTADIFK